jgi:hypothetical protein
MMEVVHASETPFFFNESTPYCITEGCCLQDNPQMK